MKKDVFTPIGDNTFRVNIKVSMPSFFLKRTKRCTKKEMADGLGMFKQVYYDLQANKYVDTYETGAIVLETKKQAEPLALVQYVPELDCLSLMIGELRCSIAAPADGCGRFVYTYHYLITRNKVKYLVDACYAGCWTRVCGRYKFMRSLVGDEDIVRKIKDNTNISGGNKAISCVYGADSIESLCKEFFGFAAAPVAGNEIVSLDNFQNLCLFLAHKSREKKTGPKQQAIDELVAKPLPKVCLREDISSPAHGIIQRVDAEYCVVRVFSKGIESCRFYVSKKAVLACNRTDTGEWSYRPFSPSGSSYDWRFSIDEIAADDVAGTRLEYLADLIIDIPSKQRGVGAWCLLSMPFVETLAKADNKMKEVVIQSLECNNPREWLFSLLGSINEKETKLFKILGINKYQYSVFAEHDFVGLNGIKSAFHNLNLSSFDNETTDVIADVFYHYNDRKMLAYWNVNSKIAITLATIAQHYGLPTMRAIAPSFKEMKGKEHQGVNDWGYRRYTDYSLLYDDYISMSVQLGCMFPANIGDIETLPAAHDTVLEVFNTKKTEIAMDQWNKRKPFWKKWEYDVASADYVVIAPSTPEDVANEGIRLHHCVKNYIGRITNGTTNIMFIRKREAVETPFFTVEVSNEGTIVQIHGLGNRNLSTEPDLIPFVNEWAKNKKIKKSNFNKVR